MESMPAFDFDLPIQSSVLNVSVLTGLKDELLQVHSRDTIQNPIYDIVANHYDCDLSSVPFTVNSIIVTIIKSPASNIYFHYKGERKKFIIPHTYTDYIHKIKAIETLLNEKLSKNGFQAKCLDSLPAKILAVKSGLCKYGRNNITYSDAFGSFILIHTYCSDMPFENNQVHDFNIMKLCEQCNQCVAHCPTNALTPERYLVRGEKCLTFLNEMTDTENFPEWVNKDAHHCIVGCMKCQINCPVNKKLDLSYVDKAEFDQEETDLILANSSIDMLPTHTLKKLEDTNLIWYYNKLPRNIFALLNHNDTINFHD